MASIMRNLFSFLGSERVPSVPHNATAGSPGFTVIGGHIAERETNAKLIGDQKWTTYREIATNTSIIAASLRAYFQLIDRTEWRVVPAADNGEGEEPSDAAKEIAEWMQDVVDGMYRPWAKTMTKAAAFKFMGFTATEWTSYKRPDGTIGLLRMDIRPQHTIKRWHVDPTGDLLGVWQRVPQTGQEVYLPRAKLLYVVDDTLVDDPQGLGVLRHCVEHAMRLKEYLRNEGMGIQRDLTGIPVGRAPIGELNQAVKDGKITETQRDTLLRGLSNILEIQSKKNNTGIMLDSLPYQEVSADGAIGFSQMYKWSVELLSGSNGESIKGTGMAIDRLNREIARILGTEHLMLGDSASGSRALSEDKTRNFYLQVEGSLSDVANAAEKDVIRPICQLNAVPEELWPTLEHEAVQFKDVAAITASLRDMATAGAVLSPRDPIIDEVRGLLGLSPQPQELIDEHEEMAAMARAGLQAAGTGKDDEDAPAPEAGKEDEE